VQRPNPSLRPEIQRGFEAGIDLELRGGALALEATYFNQIAADLIDRTVISFADGAGNPTIFQYQNIGEVANRGIELGMRAVIGSVDVRASYTYATSEVESLSEAYGGQLKVGDQLTFVPRHTAGGTVRLNLPALVGGRVEQRARVELGATYVGERRTEDQIALLACLFELADCVDDTPSFRDYWVALPSFLKLRVGVTHPLSDRLELYANVDNLTNRQRGEFYAFQPSRGRVALVGVRFGR
jgi:outer membrane receptor protein involved in Fe transport